MAFIAFPVSAADYVPAAQHGGNAMPPLQLTPDKPAILKLEQDVANIIIGNEKNISVMPDTARSVVVIPRQPGATSFSLIGTDGSIIMERTVIVASPRQDYIRVRRACPPNKPDCVPYSMYYCPDMCHEVFVPHDPATASIETPVGALPEASVNATDIGAEPLPLSSETFAREPAAADTAEQQDLQ